MAISSLICWQMVSSSSCKNQLRCCESSFTDSNSLNRWRSLTASLLSSNLPRLFYRDTHHIHAISTISAFIITFASLSVQFLRVTCKTLNTLLAGMNIGSWKALLTLDVSTEIITFQHSSTKHYKNLLTACKNALKPHEVKCTQMVQTWPFQLIIIYIILPFLLQSAMSSRTMSVTTLLPRHLSSVANKELFFVHTLSTYFLLCPPPALVPTTWLVLSYRQKN